jgi:hypothetical protein
VVSSPCSRPTAVRSFSSLKNSKTLFIQSSLQELLGEFGIKYNGLSITDSIPQCSHLWYLGCEGDQIQLMQI